MLNRQDIVKLVANGIELQTFEALQLNTSMISETTDFNFKYKPKSKIIRGKYELLDLIKPQDEVIIYINDIQYLAGFVVTVDWYESSSGEMLSISGMDKVSYCLLRSSAIPKTYTERNYFELVKTVIQDNGFSNLIKVQNLTKQDLIINKEQESIQTDGEETVYAFIGRYAKKAQVLLNTTGTGELLIYREGDLGTLQGKFPNTAKAPIALINSITKQNTNMLSTKINVSVLDRYNFIELYSQNNNSANDINSVAPSAVAVDTQIKIPNRKRVLINSPTVSTSLLEIAKWNVNIRRSQSFVYSCTLQGFSYSPENKDFWKINTYVELLDEKKDFNGEFLIASVSFKKDNTGTFTDLTIVNKGSHTLDIEKAILRLNRNNFGSQFQ